MRILLADRWIDGFLDEALPPEHLRISPVLWVRLEVVDDIFFVRSADTRRLVTYVRQVGTRATMRKVVSRYRERWRNERFVAAGLGRIVAAAGDTDGFHAEDPVFFVAPGHAACMERVVLHRDLLRPAGLDVPTGPVVFRAAPVSAGPPIPDTRIVGWSPFSGQPVDSVAVDRLVSWVAGEARTRHRADDRVLRAGSPVREIAPARRPRAGRAVEARPTAVLFGLGNYAKTQIMPCVTRHLDVIRVHEQDPLQIGSRPRRSICWDTSPVPRETERADVFLIAGYHHTHAPLAISALSSGAAAVVEKPLATTAGDLELLVKSIERGGRLFACFQRRYSPFNQWIREDLLLQEKAAPLSYSSVVFEEPLPRRHWYGWPVSRSRLVSNGCHWIDHFLWLNNFAEVRRSAVFRARADVVVVTIELVNDSVLSLTLTSAGGSRYGQRENTELRANGRTVRIGDWSRYEAEDHSRVLRRNRLNRQHSYPVMYDTICRGIVRGSPGEDAAALAATAGLTLRLDQEISSGQ